MSNGRATPGTVTFLFTDVEGSTGLWAADGEAMAASLLVYDGIVRGEVGPGAATCSRPPGDSFAAAFSRASDAMAAAVQLDDHAVATEIASDCSQRAEPDWRAWGLTWPAFLSHPVAPGLA